MSSQPVDVLAVLGRLDDIARAADVPYPRWLSGYGADQGLSFCTSCAEKRVAAGEAESVDGGWPQDNDGCCHCEDCGRLLDYTLTDYGVTEEMGHFRGDKLERDMTPELAYHLARVLEHHAERPDVLELLPKISGALARCGGGQ